MSTTKNQKYEKELQKFIEAYLDKNQRIASDEEILFHTKWLRNTFLKLQKINKLVLEFLSVI